MKYKNESLQSLHHFLLKIISYEGPNIYDITQRR